MKLPEDSLINGEEYLSDEFEDNLEILPPPVRDGDFSEYMWMENEEEFDSQVMQQLEEEELIEQCITDMVVEELDETNEVTAGIESLNVNTRTNEEVAVSEMQLLNANSTINEIQSLNVNSSSETSQHNHCNGSEYRSLVTDRPSQPDHRRERGVRFSVQNRLTNIHAGLPPTGSRSEEIMVNGMSGLSTNNTSSSNQNNQALEKQQNGLPSTLNPNAKEFVPCNNQTEVASLENGDVSI